MIDRIDNETRGLQNALNLRAYRQEVLASNIANADTPRFKARDIDFKSTFAGAMGAVGGDLALANTAPGHLQADGASRFGAALLYRTEQQSAVDGNTVNLDAERAAFADNAIQIEALLTFLRGGFKDMTAALQG